jgi:beta-glucosidase
MQVSASTFQDVDGLTVTVDVTNTGLVAGQEIVQLYVHDQESRLVRPTKELKGFAKVALQPGETKTVTISLAYRAFAYYHPAYQQWITDNGQFDLLIGASAADIRCTAVVTMQSTLTLPTLLNRDSTIRTWLDDPLGHGILLPFFQKLQAQGAGLIGSEDGLRERYGENSMALVMDMPLLSVLHSEENSLSLSPEETVNNLLQQLHRS